MLKGDGHVFVSEIAHLHVRVGRPGLKIPLKQRRYLRGGRQYVLQGLILCWVRQDVMGLNRNKDAAAQILGNPL